MVDNVESAYKTVDGDVLDAIIYKYYERHTEALQAVLDANPHLRSQPPVLPAGLEIIMPELPAETPSGRVNLWD